MDLPVLLQKVTDLKINILCFVLPILPVESDAAFQNEESCHESVLASSTTPTSAKDSSVLGNRKRSHVYIGVAVRLPFS